ncbi:MAG: hypothetical protein LBT04_03350 [Prevotellaceae bacterium]|jgi:hypothetical protein|nr:hypothetical protein [Prevotellaceae bacterium]
METKDILSIAAVIVSALLAVIITKIVDYNQQKRKDRIDIFKILISTPLTDVTYRKAEALNLVEILFYDYADVINSYREFLKTVSDDKISFETIQDAYLKMLEKMAIRLGYKKITWDILKNPYKPKGLVSYERMQQESAQLYNMVLKVLSGNPSSVQQWLQTFEVPKNGNAHEN